ncbi:hypothetical protein [Peribacillus simplex]|uniref:hypothetical protein n=1 Tax=Peribacillus simplex TaxID=1478 RepID=UPI0028533A30|nr:hypothetical protein [Peribacillus simplex]MDR4927237.1 hypothetical protein [Peribacillus simplex]
MKIIKSFLIFIFLLVLSGILIFVIYKLLNNQNLDKAFYSEISAISTAVASVGGITLLFFTYFTFLETRKQRIAQEEPAVTLRLIPDSKNSNFLHFFLKNTGGGPAYDIKITFNPDLPYGNTTLNQLTMFKRMPLLEKGEEVTFFFDTAMNYFNSDKPTTIDASAIYYTLPQGNRNTRKLIRDFEINMDERKGQRQIIKKDMNDLVKEIEELKHYIIISRIEQGEKND